VIRSGYSQPLPARRGGTASANPRDGYALNERRPQGDPDALKRLAARVRELRNNEQNIYAAVRDCFKLR
jgi:hypothetical protein